LSSHSKKGLTKDTKKMRKGQVDENVDGGGELQMKTEKQAGPKGRSRAIVRSHIQKKYKEFKKNWKRGGKKGVAWSKRNTLEIGGRGKI